ncbi:MAG TPA: hypothetical protein VK171_06640 [Fimbriimonas sp.]|nr:hypothetical protein [Fimbriimonas sp.]
MKKLVCFLALTPVCAFAQTLSTLGPNNGSGGVFFDLTPTTNNLSFNSFATYLGSATVGTPASIQVWVRTGSYVGFTTANTGWTLYETVVGNAAGTSTLTAPIAFTTPISLTAGTTTGFYIHSVTSANGIRGDLLEAKW